MLDIVESVLPQGGNGWEKVSSLFNKKEAIVVARDTDSLKRKFILLKNHKKPTGDPSCPPEVARAKRIQRSIDNKACVETMDNDNGERSSEDHGSFMDGKIVNEVGSYDTDGSSTDDDQASVPPPSRVISTPPSESRTTPLLESRAQEKPNRVGLSQKNLCRMGKALAGTQGGTPGNPTSSTMSYVAKRRQKLDRFIDQAEQISAKPSNDVMTLLMAMDERAAERQAERDERERQWKLEERRHEEEREERRAERESRNMQLHMTLMARLFGQSQEKL